MSVLDILWSDWLLAFAPIAITSWAALRSPEWRSSAAWLLAPLALYLLVAWRVLSTSWTIQATEHGAYLMPFAFPFAWLTVRGLGARHTPWIAAIAILVAVLTVRAELDAAPAAGDPLPVIAAVDDPRGVVVLADPATADAVLIEAPDMVTLRLDQLLQVPGSMLKNPGSFDQQFDTLSQSGRTVAFEQSVLAALELLDLPLASHLRREYHLERRTADGFTVVVVRPRE